MSRKPKITFFNPGLGMGGAERHTAELRSRLEKRGYDTRLLVYGRDLSPHVLAMPGAHDAELLNCTGPTSASSWTRIRAALAADDSAVLFATNHTPVISAVALKRHVRGKLIGILHATVPKQGELVRTAAFWTATRFLDALVYVSENQRKYWRARGLRARHDRPPAAAPPRPPPPPPHDRVIRNGIDLERFSPADNASRQAARHALGLSAGDFVIGLVATMRPEKNHLQLVDAHTRLRQAGIPAKVVLVGDGPCRAEVAQRVEALGLGGHTVFAGEQADVRPFVHALDVGVLCSIAIETMSLSALEMMACGLPLVLSDIGGASEIVENGRNGLLFEAGDTGGLVAGLKQVSHNEERRKFAEQALDLSTKFSLERMVDLYVELIDQVVSKKS
jgi:glycosyltransferase involved in cell wall biosynthesis